MSQFSVQKKKKHYYYRITMDNILTTDFRYHSSCFSFAFAPRTWLNYYWCGHLPVAKMSTMPRNLMISRQINWCKNCCEIIFCANGRFEFSTVWLLLKKYKFKFYLNQNSRKRIRLWKPFVISVCRRHDRTFGLPPNCVTSLWRDMSVCCKGKHRHVFVKRSFCTFNKAF